MLFRDAAEVVISVPLDQDGFGAHEHLFETAGELVASRDGQRFLINELIGTDPLFTIHVVLNFFEELRERMAN